jgi:hypothetical protein
VNFLNNAFLTVGGENYKRPPQLGLWFKKATGLQFG